MRSLLSQHARPYDDSPDDANDGDGQDGDGGDSDGEDHGDDVNSLKAY